MCAPTIDELEPTELWHIILLQESICLTLKSAVGATGFNCAWNEGEVAGQTVPHLHLHIVPRKREDAARLGYEAIQTFHRGKLLAINEIAKAFLVSNPVTPSHVAILPTRPVRNIAELSFDEFLKLNDLRNRICTQLKNTTGAQGFNYAWNEGEVSGKIVPQLELHIVPRRANDTLKLGYDPRKFFYRPGSRCVCDQRNLVEMRDELCRSLVHTIRERSLQKEANFGQPSRAPEVQEQVSLQKKRSSNLR